jgi:hypothetical protein
VTSGLDHQNEGRQLLRSNPGLPSRRALQNRCRHPQKRRSTLPPAPGSLAPNDTSSLASVSEDVLFPGCLERKGAEMEPPKRTHHGCVTDQWRKIAAKPRSITSVTTALPFLKRTPPRAGNSAKAKGTDAQVDPSSSAGWIPAGLGLKKSRASPRLCSEKVVLLLRGGPNGSLEEGLSVGRRRKRAPSSRVMERRIV